MTARVAVVGGGIGGASCALRLARAGQEVVLLERSPRLGGLVVSLEVGGTPLERFYHHVFPHEREIIGLIGDLGLGPKLGWYPSTVGMLVEGRIWPFTTALDLLRFGPLPLADRIHTGMGALRSRRHRDWMALDALPAYEWLAALCGRRAADSIWDPLLRAKFGAAARDVPAAWIWGRFRQRAGARGRDGRERLGYLRGGFRQVFDALEAELDRLGAEVRVGTGVDRIAVESGRVVGIEGPQGTLEADAVVFAGTLPGLAGLVPSELADPRWSAIGGLGAMCVVVELERRVTDTYWLNVCDDGLPLTAYIEHTNFVPASDYGGRHLAYLGRYFTQDDPVATADVDTEARRWVEALAGTLPGFRAADVAGIHPSRTPYAAPLVGVGHLGRIPPVASHIPGLYVCTTAQIYPQDRGMSEGVRLGTEAAEAVLARDRSPLPANPV